MLSSLRSAAPVIQNLWLTPAAKPVRTRNHIKWFIPLFLACFVAPFFADIHSASAQDCTGAACISTVNHLVEVDSTESELLDPLLGVLLGQGTSLGLTAGDYNALAGTNVSLGALLDQLQVDLSAATPEDVLNAEITIPQLIDALDVLLPGNIGIGALQALPEITGTIVLGDLLQLNSNPAALAGVNLNVLDLIIGAIQLFNYDNAVAVQTTALDASALAALGLPTAGFDGVSISAAVLAPPQIVCGPVGSTFNSANIRLALDLDLTDVTEPLDAIDFDLETISKLEFLEVC